MQLQVVYQCCFLTQIRKTLFYLSFWSSLRDSIQSSRKCIVFSTQARSHLWCRPGVHISTSSLFAIRLLSLFGFICLFFKVWMPLGRLCSSPEALWLAYLFIPQIFTEYILCSTIFSRVYNHIHEQIKQKPKTSLCLRHSHSRTHYGFVPVHFHPYSSMPACGHLSLCLILRKKCENLGSLKVILSFFFFFFYYGDFFSSLPKMLYRVRKRYEGITNTLV